MAKQIESKGASHSVCLVNPNPYRKKPNKSRGGNSPYLFIGFIFAKFSFSEWLRALCLRLRNSTKKPLRFGSLCVSTQKCRFKFFSLLCFAAFLKFLSRSAWTEVISTDFSRHNLVLPLKLWVQKFKFFSGINAK